jgi:hypothetical protein
LVNSAVGEQCGHGSGARRDGEVVVGAAGFLDDRHEWCDVPESCFEQSGVAGGEMVKCDLLGGVG